MSENATELRERLRNARQTKRDAEPTGTDTPGTNSTGHIASDYVGISNQPGDGTGQPTQSTIPNGGAKVRQSERAVRRPGGGSRITDRTTSKPEGRVTSGVRGATQDDRRVRQEPGRSGENNATDRADGTDLSTGVSSRSSSVAGRLERTPGDDQFIPLRNFNAENDTVGTTQETSGITSPIIVKRGRGRPRKARVTEIIGQLTSKTAKDPELDYFQTERQSPVKQVKEFITTTSSKSAGNRLSANEVKTLKEPLTAALTDEFQLLDQMLWGYANDGLNQPIWSDITDREMEAFIDSFLGLGTKSGTVATLARSAVSMNDYIVVGGMMLPRLKATVDVVRTHRKNRTRDKKR
jgi:hypothetical protein